MATGRTLHGVDYQAMVAYVASQIDPLRDDMSAHDAWHLEQATIARQADRAARLAMWGVWIAAASLLSVIVLTFIHHH